MRATRFLTWALGAFLLSFLPVAGQPYDLSWFTLDGGGGTSTGGVYSVSGTIGQPDAGVMSGGNYTLTGGFWAVAVAVQNEGAPLLTIKTVGANVILSWPSGAAGYSPVQSGSLGHPSWSAVGQSVQDDGQTRSVTVPLAPGARFYRLQK